MRISVKALSTPKSVIIWVLLVALCWGAGGCQYLPLRPGGGAEEAVHLSTSEAYYHYMMAQEYLMADNPVAAIQEYEAALKYDPNSAQMETELAALYQRMGDIKNMAVR